MHFVGLPLLEVGRGEVVEPLSHVLNYFMRIVCVPSLALVGCWRSEEVGRDI